MKVSYIIEPETEENENYSNRESKQTKLHRTGYALFTKTGSETVRFNESASTSPMFASMVICLHYDFVWKNLQSVGAWISTY